MAARPIFDKKNALVIGGAGFLGSHLCDELVRTHKVIAVDNFLTGSEHNIDHLLMNPNFEFVKHDAIHPFELGAKEEGLEKFRVAWQGVQEIYYLASPTTEGDVSKYPTETLLANSVGLYNALELAVASQASFLYVSSDLVYGEPVDGNWRVDESKMGVVNPQDKRSPYVEGKRFGEALVTAYQRHRGLKVHLARVFNTYGPRMKLTDTRLIAEFVRSALANEPITVYGGATAVGSYCYVSDIVKGLVKLMENGKDADAMNLGHDQEVKLADVAQQVVNIVESTSTVNVIDEMPPQYHHQLLPDIRKAKEELGWFPIVLMADGIRHTAEYLKASQGLIDIEGIK